MNEVPKELRLPKKFVSINKKGSGFSADKRIMKFQFKLSDVKSPEWGLMSEQFVPKQYPIVVKHKNSMKGKGVWLIENEEELKKFIEEHKDKIKDHHWEKYYKIVNEFRVLVAGGHLVDIYYKKCRKDVDIKNCKIKHNAQCIFKTKDHWMNMYEKYKAEIDELIAESIKAVNSCHLVISGVDAAIVKYQDGNISVAVFEVNSQPGLGLESRKKLLETIKMFNIKL